MSTPKARDAMIAAAERLIAERGMAALTLKDVQHAADQSNKSAAQYHFGSRLGLLSAVVDDRLGRVHRRRSELLDGWDEQGITPTARQAVEAMIGPLAAETVGRPGSHYARFLVQAMVDPALSEMVEASLSAESLRRVSRILLAHLQHLEPRTAGLRIAALMSTVVLTLARHEGQDSAEDMALIVADLIEVCQAILAAPAPTELPDPTAYEGVRS